MGADSPVPSRAKRILNVLRILAVTGVIVAVACIAFPKILTGDFADITVQGITTTPNGKVTVRFTSRASCGTPIFVQLFKNKHYVGGTREENNGGFFRRPVSREQTISFNLNPEGAPAGARFEDSPLYARLLIQAGHVYHLKGQQVLTLFNFSAGDGARYSGFIRLSASLSGI